MATSLYDKVTRRGHRVLFNPSGKPVSVGRQGDIEISLEGTSQDSYIEPICAKETLQRRVSRKHFSLRLHKGHVYLEDLRSKNGTYVKGREFEGKEIDGEEVRRKFPLVDGDEIFAGKNYSFIFNSNGKPEYAEPEEVKKSKIDELKGLGRNVLKSGYDTLMYFVDFKFLI